MTVRDWAAIGMLVITVVGMYANARVSMALRERDRKDFEALREEHDKLKDAFNEAQIEAARRDGPRA
jgi:hypothetical protein